MTLYEIGQPDLARSAQEPSPISYSVTVIRMIILLERMGEGTLFNALIDPLEDHNPTKEQIDNLSLLTRIERLALLKDTKEDKFTWDGAARANGIKPRED